jgi:imidazole glycerol phosphate synthase subunit HisF
MLEDLLPPTAPRGSCKVATILETLSQSDQEILIAAIFDSNNWPIKTLSKALAAKGLQISDTPLTSHRFKSCACFRA